MRYLNKIIFINSAHIPYAEIKLDGNIHFIGTQGVGKSTVLRAILFFYNADKSRLGIRTQDKQKSYDEFYLPHPDSYIIYEVRRENGNFCVVSFISNGRTAFRIIDCPYKRSYFITEDDRARPDWNSIREAIGPCVFKSNIIRGYEEYRNIIYGNTMQVDKNLRRFCLMESNRYQNIPRTIQNIFLNQSLESRMIKDTIIDSMDFSQDEIDLNFYREHVKDFSMRYEDIWKWYKPDKHGKIKVRTEADTVIRKYGNYNTSRESIRELCGKLGFALQRDMARLPELASESETAETELSRQKRLLREETGKYDAEGDKLNQKMGEINFFLKRIKEKQRHYQAIDITAIVEKTGKKGELTIKRESLLQQENVLTDKNKNIKLKYESLRRELENQFREFVIQQKGQINELDRDYTIKIGTLQERETTERDDINARYQAELEVRLEEINNACQELNRLKTQEESLRTINPYKDQMNELEQRITGLQKRQNDLRFEEQTVQREIDTIIHQTELKRQQMQNECGQEVAGLTASISPVEAEMTRLSELLKRQKGSLIEWLDKQGIDWKNNVGKLLDEESVLYNTALNPRKVNSSDTVFGIHLDVANIDREIRMPEEIRQQIADCEQELARLKERITQRKQTLEKDLNDLEQAPGKQVKTLRTRLLSVQTELRQIPLLVNNTQKELDFQGDRLKEWRKSEVDKLHDAQSKISEALGLLKEKETAIRSLRKEKLAKSQSEFQRQKKNLNTELNHRKEAVEKSIHNEKEKLEQVKRANELRMDAELKGMGVDVRQLREIRRQLRSIEDELAFIEQHQKDFIAWQKDTEELFDHEPEKKKEAAAVKSKIELLREKFNLRKEKLNLKISHLAAHLQSLKTEIKSLQDETERTQGFMQGSSWPSELSDGRRMETTRRLSEILSDLRDQIENQRNLLDEFKLAVNVFKRNFSSQNTFHFRTDLAVDKDYIEFAADLYDFLSNKKIEEYRTRTSEQYIDIIRRIAREVSDLNRHSADIKATINDINRDFREHNFAGVIKDIELRSVESNDRLMLHLVNIKNFADENSFNLGELNLFSNENREQKNRQAVELLMALTDLMNEDLKRERITLSDTFKLEFKVKENDNDTNWVEKLSNVGSDGTDILVKSMVNIMLINVFKQKVSRKFGDFKLHCMMDEIGKLHPNNVEGILKFANVRKIFLINSSPTTYNASAYRYTYALSKDQHSNTIVKTLLTIQ